MAHIDSILCRSHLHHPINPRLPLPLPLPPAIGGAGFPEWLYKSGLGYVQSSSSLANRHHHHHHHHHCDSHPGITTIAMDTALSGNNHRTASSSSTYESSSSSSSSRSRSRSRSSFHERSEYVCMYVCHSQRLACSIMQRKKRENEGLTESKHAELEELDEAAASSSS